MGDFGADGIHQIISVNNVVIIGMIFKYTQQLQQLSHTVPMLCFAVKLTAIVYKMIIRQLLSLLDTQKTVQFQGDAVYISGETTSKNGL